MKYPPPDDGLTDAASVRLDHERRAEQIERAAEDSAMSDAACTDHR